MGEYCMRCMLPTEGAQICPHCGYEAGGDAPAHVLSPGTVLNDRYLIGEVIGQGGFGITYIGRDLRLNMRIAVKEYYPNGNNPKQEKKKSQKRKRAEKLQEEAIKK